MKRSKKLLLAVCLCATFMACDDEKHILGIEDLAGFAIDNGSGWLGPEEPAIVTLTPGSADFEYEICVTRNGFSANEYPKFTAQVVLDPSTTAAASVDFTLPETPIVFSSAKKSIQRFRIIIHATRDSEPRKIVLKLEYGDEDTCPVQGRKADRTTISLNPKQ